MKIIKDIRLYRSNKENIEGNSLPSGFRNKKLQITVQRIVMKLREKKFSFGEFDHLYLNFTPLLKAGKILPAKRDIDRYHSWYRYYDVGVTQNVFDSLENEEVVEEVIALVKQALISYFLENENNEEKVSDSISEAIEKGEKMLIFFKEKKTSKSKAIIYLRYLDEEQYKPLLCVYDIEGNEILREDLPTTLDFSFIGNILLNSKRVVYHILYCCSF